MNKLIAVSLCLLLNVHATNDTNQATLLPDSVVAALSQELSGETAKSNLEYIARHHRMRGSRGFRSAADHIVKQLRDYGISDARVEQFPADGKTFYGTQKSRPPWDAEFAELWEMRETNAGWTTHARLASWDAMPVTLAQDSESGEATAELIDVNNGTSESDYTGKDVRGKIVLAAAQPGPVARLAVERFGAVGIVSYAQNQRTAWWGENENLVRWGHLDTFAAKPTFAFMISPKQARNFQGRLARGEKVRLHATVRAGKHSGFYDVATATNTRSRSKAAQRRDSFQLSSRSSTSRRKRQRQWQRRDPRSGACSQQADQGRQNRAPGTDDSLHLATRDRRDYNAAQRASGNHVAYQSSDPYGHGRRWSGNKGYLSRDAWSMEPALVRK